jgi:hypothetical protein
VKRISASGGLEKSIQILTRIHYNVCTSSDILRECEISDSGFVRHKRMLRKVLGVIVVAIPHGKNTYIYRIVNYGLIDKTKL